ncbi:MAG: sigma-70 family RNA polymerase sigma factor [Myxococcota bacterium]
MVDPEDEHAIIREQQQVWAGKVEPRAELVRRVNALFDRHRDRIRGYCRTWVDDAAKADELANDVLLTAWRRLPDYDFSSTFVNWLYGIARFTCMRAPKERQAFLFLDEVLEPSDPAASVWRLCRRDERRELLLAAIEQLTDLEQEALFLRYFEDAPVDRITELLGLKGRTGARGLLQGCRRHLRKRLLEVMTERGLGTSFWRSTR